MADDFATLFTGGDLFGIGARSAGLAPRWGVESDWSVLEVALRNGESTVVWAPVEEVDYSCFAPVLLLHMSPVCKRASTANPDAEEAPEDLDSARACARAIRALRPRIVSLENVMGYRHFQSFRIILEALRECGYAIGCDWDGREGWHMNAADYGVPQTRKRLILLAALDFEPEKPRPTHYNPASIAQCQLTLFDRDDGLLPWMGWYEAVEDIIHTFPESPPAPWQRVRFQKTLSQMTPPLLLSPAGSPGQVIVREGDEPAVTVVAAGEKLPMRAYVLESTQGGKKNGWSYPIRAAEQPIFTVTGTHALPRAWIVGGGNTNLSSIDSAASRAEEPYFTVTASDGAKKTACALLLDGDNARPDTGAPTMRGAAEPSMSIRAGILPAHRALLLSDQRGEQGGVAERDASEPAFTVVPGNGGARTRVYTGRWVKFTPRGLARLQTLPDSFYLPDLTSIACTVIGNGYPSKLARAVCLSSLAQYRRRQSRKISSRRRAA